MWNLKRSCSNVLFKVNLLAVKNVRMASKKTVTEEKSKVPKKGFFRRSESVASDESSKTVSPNSAAMEQKSESSDNKRLMRRSSMICSEGIDKYTFDTRKQNALAKSAGKEPNTLPLPDEIASKQSQAVSENNALGFIQTSKPTFPEQTAVKKISAFKPLSALSISSPGKNAPLPFKRVPEETIPVNIPFSYKRVPEETVPNTNTYTVNNSGNTSPVTTIPLSFSSVSEEAKWTANTNASKANPIKSTPVKNSPYSVKSVPEKNAHLSHVPEKSSRPVTKAFSFKSDQTPPLRNVSLFYKPISEEFPPSRNTPLTAPLQNTSSYNTAFEKFSSSRNTPLTHPLQNASSYKLDSVKFPPSRNTPLTPPLQKNSSYKPASEEFPPSKTSPIQNASSDKPVSEELLPSQNTSLTPPLRNASLSYKPVSEDFSLSKTTPLKPPLRNASLSYKPISEEFSPSRNTPLTPPLRKASSAYKPASEEFPPSKTSPIQNASSDKPVSEELLPSQNTSLTPPLRNASLSYKPVSEDFSLSKTTPLKPPLRNASLSYKPISEEFSPSRNTPLTPPLRKASSAYKPASEEFPPSRSFPLTNKAVTNELKTPKNYFSSQKPSPDEFIPSRNTPLTFTNIPKQNVSSNYISDQPIPIRNAPLSLKGESVSLRNIPSSLKHFSDDSSSSTRKISSLQPVPEEPAPLRDFKNVPDEPIPFRNSPLFLKPILTKHISLLKKKTPSFKGPIIKRDSVVHPGKIDMQGSLFIDGRFQNPWPTWKPPTFANILKFGVARNKSKVPPKQELDLILPIVKQNFSKLSIPDDGIRVTWIGHSTVLIQMHGLNILTDPMFSDRASPSQVVGPKRYRDPPCTIHDLPHINAVVISHSHYDHLDHNTITLLNARFGTDIRWFVPLGLQAWMEDVGCENVVELDWWEENCVPEHSDTFFVFTPAQHWSKRTINDDNKVLWGSWCVLGPKYKFFFAGDTGYCDVFKQIGRVHGPFDLSAIPIGAYEPRWFMKYQHINPEEAVKLHMDIRSKRSLAIHWGTFSLANEYYLDPPVKLREGLDKYEIPPELFFTLKHGESRLISPNNLVKKYPLNERNTKES